MTSLKLEFVCKVLQQHKLLNEQQIQTVVQQESDIRAQLKQQTGVDASMLTAIDVLCAMHLVSAADGQTVLSEELIMRALAAHWKLPFLRIELNKVESCKLASKISAPFARKHAIFPVSMSKNMLFIAVVNPLNVEMLDTLRNVTKMEIRPVISLKSDIFHAIEECYKIQEAEKTSQKHFEGFEASVSAASAASKDDAAQAVPGGMTSVNADDANDANIVTAVNLMLQYACEQRASEIHLEPRQFQSQIRFRIDGMLYDVKQIPQGIHNNMLMRFKALGGMNISEKRKAQDGRTHFSFHGRDMTLRISTMPMTFGEKVMIRLLDPILLLRHVETLGFSDEQYAQYRALISRANGILLIAGPTGSGKTTTLYSTLDALAERGINVTTLEDPVELPYDRFNQIALQPGAGFDFEQAVKHLVRQSPDVIMIGEVRDKQTADNAIQTALLGHLVFSTLHTYDAASALTRLVKMGAEPFLVESAVIAVIAQQLLRRVCQHCAQPYRPSGQDIALLQLSSEQAGLLRKGKGCMKCRGTGYLGQTGVFEILEMTDELRSFVHDNIGVSMIRESAAHQGVKLLRDMAMAKMLEGQTTVEEVLRMTAGIATPHSARFKTKITLSNETESVGDPAELEAVSF